MLHYIILMDHHHHNMSYHGSNTCNHYGRADEDCFIQRVRGEKLQSCIDLRKFSSLFELSSRASKKILFVRTHHHHLQLLSIIILWFHLHSVPCQTSICLFSSILTLLTSYLCHHAIQSCAISPSSPSSPNSLTVLMIRIHIQGK